MPSPIPQMLPAGSTKRAVDLAPLAVGPHVIAVPVLLAPMSGITDLPFRRLAHRLGAPLTFTEMIASREFVKQARRQPTGAARFDADRGNGLHAVQLAGCEPETMAEAARIARDGGADLLDINFGCPVKKVTKGQMAGSALMRDEDRATRIVAAVVAAVDIPVSVKMRTGWDDQSRNAPSLARRVEAVGAAVVTIHGRTREQLYKGNVDWSFIKKVKESISIPVVANGDIGSPETIARCLRESGADGVMIGRATQGKPWLVGSLANWARTGAVPAVPSAADRCNLLLEHYHAMLSYYGPRRGVPLARKHLGWATHDMPGAARAREALFAAERPDQVEKILRGLFNSRAEPLARAA